MCGIIGYIGKNNSIPRLINGLKALEYREREKRREHIRSFLLYVIVILLLLPAVYMFFNYFR